MQSITFSTLPRCWSALGNESLSVPSLVVGDQWPLGAGCCHGKVKFSPECWIWPTSLARPRIPSRRACEQPGRAVVPQVSKRDAGGGSEQARFARDAAFRHTGMSTSIAKAIFTDASRLRMEKTRRRCIRSIQRPFLVLCGRLLRSQHRLQTVHVQTCAANTLPEGRPPMSIAAVLRAVRRREHVPLGPWEKGAGTVIGLGPIIQPSSRPEHARHAHRVRLRSQAPGRAQHHTWKMNPRSMAGQ